jgi:predicted ATPase
MIDKLSVPQQMTLRLCAIAGKSFTVRLLATAIPDATARNRTATLSKYVKDLTRVGLLTEYCRDAGEDEAESVNFKFTSILVQQIVYGQTPFTYRKEL